MVTEGFPSAMAKERHRDDRCRKWADWSFVPMLKGKKDYSHNPVYTRNLTTSYKGQLLEINFTSNLNTGPKLKQEIDRIMDSVRLEE